MGVRAAATEVARAGFFNFRLRRVLFLMKERSERHDKTGGAIAAHQSVALNERPLDTSRVFLVAEAFDAQDFLTFHLDG